jgi:signal transduction histidine kinase
MNALHPTANVLAVDDDPKSLLALQALLGEMPAVRVVTAKSGDEALRHMLKEDFAVVLMDARMPAVDGFETARLIRERERSRHTPVIFLTGAYEDLSSVARGYEVGAVDYIVKPPAPEILKSKVSVFVELHRKNVKLMQEIIERRRAEEELRRSQSKLRDLATHLQAVREEEWTRISREIHDELGQALTGIKMDVMWLAQRLPAGEPALRERAQSACDLIDATVESVREIAARLRPEVLDQMGLAAAIDWQAGDFQRRSGIRCSVSLPAQATALDRERSTAAFRIFQELLTNVVRHAGATRIDVAMQEAPGALLLTVEDNGRGIEAAALDNPKSLGLIGMRERVLPFGGSIDIAGESGKGTRVKVLIPHV